MIINPPLYFISSISLTFNNFKYRYIHSIYMINQSSQQTEQLIRVVSPIGNGAHIFAPREWIGEEIMLVRTPKQSISQKILSLLEPYLGSIIGVYIYGSHARQEANKDSDIDLLLIINKKINIKEKGYEILQIEEDKFADALELNPLMIYSMLAEAKPIINSNLLNKLKDKYKFNLDSIKPTIEETKRIININESLLNGISNKEIKSTAEAYSLILRLRSTFIIKQLINKKSYSNKDFKGWINSNSDLEDINSLFEAYKSVKLEKKSKLIPVKVNDLLQLLSLLKKETSIIENKIHGKKKKAS